MVKVELSGAKDFFDVIGPDYSKISDAHRTLLEKTGAGSEFTGWLELPQNMLKTELKAIQSAAARIKGNSEVLVVVGIGGSYLGARAAIELLRSPNYNLIKKDTPDIFFVGNGLSADAINETIELIGDRDFSVNVISKSGGTLEPALGFRVFKALLEKKYGANAKKRIYATTDAERGLLHDMAAAEGWERFIVPGDVGGRFSVLSAVGILPMAVAGIDVESVLSCAVQELQDLTQQRSAENPAWQYAGARQHLYTLGRTTEILACYEPSFRFMAEWWKQLFGESEADQLMAKFRISGVPIVDTEGKLIGIITNRDMKFETDMSQLISNVMTSDNLVTGKVGTTLEQAKDILRSHKIEKLPIVDDEGHLRGLITIKDIEKALT